MRPVLVTMIVFQAQTLPVITLYKMKMFAIPAEILVGAVTSLAINGPDNLSLMVGYGVHFDIVCFYWQIDRSTRAYGN